MEERGQFDVSYIDGSEFDITDDYPELKLISQQSSYGIERCGGRFRSVFDDGFVIAHAETVRSEDTARIIEFFVHEDFRGLSVGTILLDAIETALKADGVKNVFLDDRDKIAFFVKNGYTEVQDHYYKDLTCSSTCADRLWTVPTPNVLTGEST